MSLQKKLQACMERAIANHEAAGCNLMILKDGEELCYAEAGHADIASGKPVRRDSIFRLYSQSKPITAAAIMILAERGLIDLMDGVDQYLPGFSDGKIVGENGELIPALRAPWILELLGMTAGLCYPDADAAGQYAARVFERQQELIEQGKGMDTVTFCNELGKQPRAFQPGTHWRYSTCADILGAVVEVVTGKKFGDFLKEEIFDPLGMKDTAFRVPGEKADRLVTAYTRIPGGLEEFHKQHLAVGIYDREPDWESGGAGLVSTLDDYAAFAGMLLNGGEYHGQRILKENTVCYMTQPQLNDRQRMDMWDSLCGYSYGKLMRHCVEPGAAAHIATAGEYGWDGWLGTYFANLPKEKVTFLMFQNTTDTGTSAMVRKCRSILGAELE